MLTEQQVDDLVQRLSDAADKLRVLAMEGLGERGTPVDALSQRARLLGKAQGIRLALSYLREYRDLSVKDIVQTL